MSLRNPQIEPYRALIVEITQKDDSRNRWRDPLIRLRRSLALELIRIFTYVTTLTKTSVEIMNVQLLAGDSKEVHSPGVGARVVAMSELRLSPKQQDRDAGELQLAEGAVHWLPGPAHAFKNLAKEPARFVVLEMK